MEKNRQNTQKKRPAWLAWVVAGAIAVTALQAGLLAGFLKDLAGDLRMMEKEPDRAQAVCDRVLAPEDPEYVAQPMLKIRIGQITADTDHPGTAKSSSGGHKNSGNFCEAPDKDEKPVYATLEGHYEGEESGGVAEGYGICTWGTDSQFQGAFEDGHPVSGAFVYADGTRKLGTDWKWCKNEKLNFMNDYPESSLRYSGMCLDGEPCGWGVLEFDSFGTFYGEFKDGLPCGWGLYRYKDYNIREEISGSPWSLRPWGKLNDKLDGTGLMLNKTIQGFGITESRRYHEYYVGEVEDGLRGGYGEYYDSKGCLKDSGLFAKGYFVK